MEQQQVDGVLASWGARLLYPRARKRPASDDPKVPGSRGGTGSGGAMPSADDVRGRIKALVRGAPQVLVKITGASTGLRGLRTHLRYVTERGEVLHDEQERAHEGPDAVRRLGDQWQHAGSLIPQQGSRREALHITLDMPVGTDAAKLKAAVAAWAQREFGRHKYAWAFHGHQQHPHVHLLVRVEDMDFKRLDPRKADLARWRQTFAQELQARGIEAEATSRVAHGAVKNKEPIWVSRGRKAGEPVKDHPLAGRVTMRQDSLESALVAWGHIHNALAASPLASDRALAVEVRAFVERMPMVEHLAGMARQRLQEQQRQSVVRGPQQGQEPELGR